MLPLISSRTGTVCTNIDWTPRVYYVYKVGSFFLFFSFRSRQTFTAKQLFSHSIRLRRAQKRPMIRLMSPLKLFVGRQSQIIPGVSLLYGGPERSQHCDLRKHLQIDETQANEEKTQQHSAFRQTRCNTDRSLSLIHI